MRIIIIGYNYKKGVSPVIDYNIIMAHDFITVIDLTCPNV